MGDIVVRDLDERLGKSLKSVAKKRGTSVNKLVHRYIEAGLTSELGSPRANQDNDLMAFVGRWSENEAAEFDKSIQDFGRVEAELWK